MMSYAPILIVFGTLMSSLPAHAEGGVGVKNGGSAIYCPQLGPEVSMLEVFEAQYTMGSNVQKTSDRQKFFDRIFTVLEAVHTYNASKLSLLISQMMLAHGPIEKWSPTNVRVPTIMQEDQWNSSRALTVDWVTATIHLNNGCQIFPVSYLTPLNQNALPVPPQIIRENVARLDAFNRNVLELHEALYEAFTTRNQGILNVVPTRKLMQVLIDGNSSLARIAAEIEFFMADHSRSLSSGISFYPRMNIFKPIPRQEFPYPLPQR